MENEKSRSPFHGRIYRDGTVTCHACRGTELSSSYQGNVSLREPEYSLMTVRRDGKHHGKPSLIFNSSAKPTPVTLTAVC